MMRKITDEEARWAYDKWCIGYTQIQIADALHVSGKTLMREFRRRGYVRIRPVLKYYNEVVK